MDAAEVPDWARVTASANAQNSPTRPPVFVAGLEGDKDRLHVAVAAILFNRPAGSPLRFVSIAEAPQPHDSDYVKEQQGQPLGLLKNSWPLKYIERRAAVLVQFLNLEWDAPNWDERVQEVVSKLDTLRTAAGKSDPRVALVLCQHRPALPPAGDQPLAAERAASLCHATRLSAKQLFVLPAQGELEGYISKLESALHEMALSYYSAKIKKIRARSIPNNHPVLVVRQLFKQGFLSELRQDSHTALRNYKLAYEQLRDHWSVVDLDTYELRSVVGLLHFKVCELYFAHGQAAEALKQMARHEEATFSKENGRYPTPELAAIEASLWKSKQCWLVADLFTRAIANGLLATAAAHPGVQLDEAARHYSHVIRLSTELRKLQGWPDAGTTPFPQPDPLEGRPAFYGQRPWRSPFLAVDEQLERQALLAIMLRLRPSRDGVVALWTHAAAQYKKYGCQRQQRRVLANVIFEHAHQLAEGGVDVAATSPRVSSLAALVLRDSALPQTAARAVLKSALFSATVAAALRDWCWCAVQLLRVPAGSGESVEKFAEEARAVAQELEELKKGRPPQLIFAPALVQQGQVEAAKNAWNAVFASRAFVALSLARLPAAFIAPAKIQLLAPGGDENVGLGDTLVVRITLSFTAPVSIPVDGVTAVLETGQQQKQQQNADNDTAMVLTWPAQNLPAAGRCPGTLVLQKMVRVDAERFKEGALIWVRAVAVELIGGGDRIHVRLDSEPLDPQITLQPTKRNVYRVTEPRDGVDLILNETEIAEKKRTLDCLVGEPTRITGVLRNGTGAEVRDVRLIWTAPATDQNVPFRLVRSPQSDDENGVEKAAAPVDILLADQLLADAQVTLPPELYLLAATTTTTASSEGNGPFPVPLFVHWTTTGVSETSRRRRLALEVRTRTALCHKADVIYANGLRPPGDQSGFLAEHRLLMRLRLENTVSRGGAGASRLHVVQLHWQKAPGVHWCGKEDDVQPVDEQLLDGETLEFGRTFLVDSSSILERGDDDAAAELAPISHVVVHWTAGQSTPVRTVIQLPKLKIVRPPLVVALVPSSVASAPLVRHPLRVHYELRNLLANPLDLVVAFDAMTPQLSEAFMFAGDKKRKILLPAGEKCRISVTFVPLVPGRITMPRPRITSTNGADLATVIETSVLAALPSHIHVGLAPVELAAR